LQGGFYRFELTPVNIASFRIEKSLGEKLIEMERNMFMLNGLAMIILIINGFLKMT